MQNLKVSIAGMKPFVAASVELSVDQLGNFGFNTVIPGPRTVTLHIKSALPMDVIKSMSAWRDSTMSASKSYKRQIEIDLGNGKKWVIHGAFIAEMQSQAAFMAMQEAVIDLKIVADSYAEDTSNKDTSHPESFIGRFNFISDVSVCLKKNGRVLVKGMTIFVKEDGHFYTYGDFGWEKRASGFNVASLKKDEMKSLEQLNAEEKGKKEKAEAEAAKKLKAKEALAKKKAMKKIVHPPDPKHNPAVQTFVDFAKGESKTGMQVIDALTGEVLKSSLVDPVFLGAKPKPGTPGAPAEYIDGSFKVEKPKPAPPTKDEIFPRKRVIRRKKA